MSNRVLAVWCCSALLICMALGCGSGTTEPDVLPVSGTVTIDGQPGANLQISFEPVVPEGTSGKNAGGISAAITDAGGHYELKYKGTDKKGAVIGSHLVRITPTAGGGPAGGESAAAIVELPAIYNTESTLRKEVKKGEPLDKMDFELKTMP